MGSKPSTGTTSIAAEALPARSVEPSPSAVADTNMALVIGRLVAEPESRTLPSGSIAASFSLTVRSTGEKTTSVPAVWYDPPKRVLKWVAGERVVAHGSVVRRFFRGAGGLGSATEVVVHQAELERHSAKAVRLVTRVNAKITERSLTS